jgi:hypothetical protein
MMMMMMIIIIIIIIIINNAKSYGKSVLDVKCFLFPTQLM